MFFTVVFGIVYLYTNMFFNQCVNLIFFQDLVKKAEIVKEVQSIVLNNEKWVYSNFELGIIGGIGGKTNHRKGEVKEGSRKAVGRQSEGKEE